MKFKYGNFFGLVFRLLFTVIMIAVLYSYAMFQGGFISWFLFYSVVTIVGLGMLSTVTPLKFVQVSRTIRDHQLKNGDHTTVEVTVRKTGPFPLLYLGVMDEVPKGCELKVTQVHSFLCCLPKRRHTVMSSKASNVDCTRSITSHLRQGI
ncbi:hypothetical protein [Geomicrobium sp. JCM 19039]|uniref:hypothetical protein n=1 Tax=Geomicrobium sp. JCM 19039 TaxID=1460636 RepID=UPI0012690FB9|nr:hypothetical protein [Geomicrobium sp. JCM 19039]